MLSGRSNQVLQGLFRFENRVLIVIYVNEYYKLGQILNCVPSEPPVSLRKDSVVCTKSIKGFDGSAGFAQTIKFRPIQI
jgi:hypothetical protein